MSASPNSGNERKLMSETYRIPGQYDTSNNVRLDSKPRVLPSALLPMLAQPLRSSSSRAESLPKWTTPSSVIGHRAKRNIRSFEDRPGCFVRVSNPRSVKRDN
jgi:hypothetical protein